MHAAWLVLTGELLLYRGQLRLQRPPRGLSYKNRHSSPFQLRQWETERLHSKSGAYSQNSYQKNGAIKKTIIHVLLSL
jgi:hypothetical protein